MPLWRGGIRHPRASNLRWKCHGGGGKAASYGGVLPLSRRASKGNDQLRSGRIPHARAHPRRTGGRRRRRPLCFQRGGTKSRLASIRRGGAQNHRITKRASTKGNKAQERSRRDQSHSL